MSSILTNTAAMTALQTLKGINKNLSMIQEQVSTGKKINTAKDNAGIWAVASVMDSDVRGFKAISE
jgi:flagellin